MNLAARIMAIAVVGFALSGCGKTATYRYKLTLSLDTPDGVKSGSNVVEVRYSTVSIPERGVTHKTFGQAIYVDLGVGRRPLIALLTSARQRNRRPEDARWAEDDPSPIFVRSCLNLGNRYDFIDAATAIAGCRTPLELSTSDLPDLVTFADQNDPKSVVKVDPNNLSATLSSGVSWRSATIEATDDPVTTGIEKSLPWLPKMTGSERLDGGSLGYPNGSLANSLQSWNFLRK